jgi:anti-sigma factor RsiW
MNTMSECEQTLLVQADFDGELDAAQAAALVRHREECAECRAVEEKLVRARTLLRAAPRYASSTEFRERLGRSIEDSARARGEAPAHGDESPRDSALSRGRAPLGSGATFRDRLSSVAARDADEGDRSARSQPRAGRWSWQSSAGWAAAAAVALVAVIFSVSPRSPDVGAQLVDNHLRAMQLDSHLIDVVSTDHHTVKPWFAGKVDFAPPVKQLDAAGYVLKGGRIDVVDARTAAVLVYQAGRHTVEVFIWPARPESATTFQSEQRNGFNLRRWKDGSFEVWCVSDMAGEELDTFARRWRDAS